ncbi:YfbU family protein [Marinomonas lutimaris]|uniref:YfbU family protein n=1 Tax=Marinomonas lutimaris TaxID=2846746 RepID=UPI001CA58F17
MEISKKDRVMLINQYRILALLDENEASHYNELIQILENGYSKFYSLIDQWVSDDMPEEEGELVLNILTLYRAIDSVKSKFKSEEVTQNPYSIFPGFDGNNETEYMSFARFLVKEQGKFREQERYLKDNDDMNSHSPMVNKYKRMIEKSKNIDIWEMGVKEALSILNA